MSEPVVIDGFKLDSYNALAVWADWLDENEQPHLSQVVREWATKSLPSSNPDITAWTIKYLIDQAVRGENVWGDSPLSQIYKTIQLDGVRMRQEATHE